MKKISFLYSLLLFCVGFFYSCEKENNAIQIDFEVSQIKVTAGEKVTFNDLSSGNVSAWNWSFEGGTPATSQLSQPEIIYNQAGQFSVTLEVRNTDGSYTLTKEKFITVGNSKVKADFTSNTVNTMNDTPVIFTDLSSGSVSEWKWTFTPISGEPIISNEQNPEIIFSHPDTYSVKLEISNEDYSDTKIVENYLTVIDAQSVIADFTTDKQFTYEGGTISFTDKSIGRIISWLWKFEGADVSTSIDQNPSIKFTKSGRHKITLTASNGEVENTIVKEQYISVISSDALSVLFTFDGVIQDERNPNITPKIEQMGTITFENKDRKDITGNVAYFDGTGGFIIKDDDAFNFEKDNYTIAIWLKVSKENNAVRMVPWQESGAGGSGDNQTWLRLYSTATNQLSFATEDSDGGSTLHLTASNSSVYNIANGEWRHVVCVREGLKTTIYIDGVQIRSVSSSKGIKDVSNEGNFKVGFQESGVGKYINNYTGSMDDLIIYKRALSAKEIGELYTY